jgi:hypothetical protein
MKLISQQDIDEIKELYKAFGVKCQIKHKNGRPWMTPTAYFLVNQAKCVLYVFPTLPRDVFWSNAFHELCHALCQRGRIYWDYHRSDNDRVKITKFRQIAWRAENYVDKQAEKLCKIYRPDVKFNKAYRCKKSKEFVLKLFRN